MISTALMVVPLWPPPEVAQTCKGSGDTHISLCFAPMEGREALSPGCSSWEYSFEKDSGDHRCLPDRMGGQCGNTGWCGVFGNPLGGSGTSTSWN